MKGKLSIYLPLFLCAMSCQEKGGWIQDHISSHSPSYRSSKLVYISPDPLYGMTLELVKIQNNIKGYLLIHSTSLPSTHKKELCINYRIEKAKLTTTGYRMQGGQKVLLEDLFVEEILKCAQEKKTIEVSLLGFSLNIDPKGFSKEYEKFKNPPVHPPLFRLPF